MSRTPRVDPDAWQAEWPVLFEDGMPDVVDYIRRDGRMQLAMEGIDAEELEAFASYFLCTPSGLLLLILFEYVHGSYVLSKMRRERIGLFKGIPSVDPAPWSTFMIDEDRIAHFSAPARLVSDLADMATSQGLAPSALTNRIVRRYLDGHLEPGDWPLPAEEK